MAKVVVRFQLHCVAAAYGTWAASAADVRAARARSEAQSRVKFRVVQKFRRKVVGEAWSRWVEHAALRAGLSRYIIWQYASVFHSLCYVAVYSSIAGLFWCVPSSGVL